MDKEKGKVRTFVEGHKTAILSGVGIVTGIVLMYLGFDAIKSGKVDAKEIVVKAVNSLPAVPKDEQVKIFKGSRGFDTCLILDAGEKLVEAMTFTNMDNPEEVYVLKAITENI